MARENAYEFTLLANAKINLSLSVLRRREDGYHELDMLTQSIGLADRLSFRESGVISLRLRADESVPFDESVPNDETNLVWKAARLVQTTYGISSGVTIELMKRIPSGAGLGGGSADAAAVLHGVNRLWGLALPLDSLLEMAVSLGADVPFCLRGGFLRVRGIGERLTAIEGAPSFPVVIVKPDMGLSTAYVFSAYDRLGEKPANPCIDSTIKALSKNQIEAFTKTLGNALQEPAISLLPEITECVSALDSLGAIKAQMTGSGSAVFGIFSDESKAQSAYAHCRKKWKQTYLTRTVQSGVTTIFE